jgi:hypothetical protein
VTSREVEKISTGRFPAPHVAWIVNQLPRELHGMFGFRGEEVPEKYDEEIEYVYKIAYPDGSAYLKSLLVEYISGRGIPTGFIIDDEIDLDGVRMIVKNHLQRDVQSGGEGSAYVYHRVTVDLPEDVDG